MRMLALFRSVRQALAQGNAKQFVELTFGFGRSDWCAFLADTSLSDIIQIVRWVSDSRLSLVVATLDVTELAAVIGASSQADAIRIIRALRPDDATDVIDRLSTVDAEELLVAMDPAEAAEIRNLLTYPADSAGGIMTPAFVAVAPEIRADEAIAALRLVAAEAETITNVYVVDAEERLLGVLSLRRLVLTPPETRVADLADLDPIRVRADTDQEVAARLLTDNDLLALPVVDAQDRLVGIITHDDVQAVLEAEATEDIARLGGSEPLEISYRQASILLLFRRRIVWLLALFVAEAYTGTVLRAFEDELTDVVALSFFIPLLIGTGGNIGSQTTTTLVRAMALGEVRLRDVRWVLAKEVSVGLAIGGVMAACALGRAELLGVGADVGTVVAITIAAICLWSSTVAAVLPMLLRRLRVDPAVVSAPLITTLVDGTGLVIYFTIAKIVLDL